jgi:hypothetical protein
MVRKQIYVRPEQDAQIKQVSDRTGETEAEIIRRAIDQQMSAVSPRTDYRAWEEERAFIQSMLRQSPIPGKRAWTREELHDREDLR